MTRQEGGGHETEQATVGLPIPASEPDLFRHTATNDLLQLLLDNPYEELTIRELSRLTDNAAQSVKRAVDVLETNRLDELGEVQGVLVSGSVAEGRADRQSNINLWVLTDDRADQHRANELATELGEERFDGDRYEFQILVETPGQHTVTPTASRTCFPTRSRWWTATRSATSNTSAEPCLTSPRPSIMPSPWPRTHSASNLAGQTMGRDSTRTNTTPT